MRDVAQNSVDRGKDVQAEIERIQDVKKNIWCPPPNYKQEEFMKTVAKTNKHLSKNELEIEIIQNDQLLEKGCKYVKVKILN